VVLPVRPSDRMAGADPAGAGRGEGILVKGPQRGGPTTSDKPAGRAGTACRSGATTMILDRTAGWLLLLTIIGAALVAAVMIVRWLLG